MSGCSAAWVGLAWVWLAAAPAATFASSEVSVPDEGSFHARLGAVRLHYEVHGTGPVLMTLPNSWGLSLDGLRELYRPLEARLRMVYFDPRGMGTSSPAPQASDRGMRAVREDFEALRQHLGVGPAAVIGWSNGAMNLLLLASERPDTVSTAIFVSGTASYGPDDQRQAAEKHPELVPAFQEFFKRVSEPGLSADQQTALQRELWLGTYFPILFADPHAAPALLDRMFGHAQMSWPHAAATNAEAADWDVRDRLASIGARSLVIAGAHDLAPPAKVRQIHEGLGDSSFVVLEHSGHFGPLEEPEAFRDAVFGFLGVGDAGGASGR